MIDYVTPEPIKDLIYACQSMLHWHNEYTAEGEWSALSKENTFRERIRALVPLCIELLKHNPSPIDSE